MLRTNSTSAIEMTSSKTVTSGLMDSSSTQVLDQQSPSGITSDDTSDDEDSLNAMPSKKRKRPTRISCELCKARKVKCGREDPSCSWCTKNNRVCIYKERKRPDLKASYGVELEDKINRIEAALYLLGRRVEDHITSGTCSEDQPSSAFLDHPRSQLPPLQTSNDDYSQNTSASQTPWLSLPSSNLDHMQNAQSAESVSGPSEHLTALTSKEYVNDDAEFPPKDLLYNLVDLYFKHVGTWSPILDRKATFDTLFGSAAPLGDDEKLLLHAIITVTLRFCNDPRLTPQRKKKYHDRSKQKVQVAALEAPSIVSMKALALVTVDVLGTLNGPQGWNLLALLARNMVQLGLDTEKSVYLAPASAHLPVGRPKAFALPQPTSWIEDEGRRRLFWLAYILDRYATIATNFDFILDEQEIDRSLPCRYDLFSKNEPVETRWLRPVGSAEHSTDRPENLGSFSYHCEVLKILSQIHAFLRTPVDIDSVSDVNRWRNQYRDLDTRLNAWLSNLPGEYGKISQLCHSDPGSRVSNWIMIHAAFVTSVIRLHSVPAYPTSKSHLFASSPNAVQRCLAAVESLRAIAQDVIDTGMLDLLGPPFAFALWTSGRLLLVHSAATESPVDDKIWFLITTLETMGQYWDIARNWAATLARLVREGQQADEDSREGRAVLSGKTYTEMRRCANDLAMLMARKSRTVLDPPATRSTSFNELEYLDVFEWFSYPRIPSAFGRHHPINNNANTNTPTTTTQSNSSSSGGFPIDNNGSAFATPTRESDWLSFKQPYEFKPPYE